MRLRCPICGCDEWVAIEQVSAETPCNIVKTPEGVEIEPSPVAEFVRNMSTSVTVAYMCKDEPCRYTFPASDVERMFSA